MKPLERRVTENVAAPNWSVPILSNRTELSELVDAELSFPATSAAAAAGMLATTVPGLVIPVTVTV